MLQDGRVLIAGWDKDSTFEIYDPGTGMFSRAGKLLEPQYVYSATALRNGKVLLGGIRRAELFDPHTGQFSLAGAYPPRKNDYSEYWYPSAIVLADGKVLLVGDTPSQIYDPETDSFTSVTSNDECDIGLCGLYDHTATRLDDGRVLVAGGRTDEFPEWGVDIAQLYQPTEGGFVPTGRMTRTRTGHLAAKLADGRVLLAGGESASCVGASCVYAGIVSSAEIYDPASGSFSAASEMLQARRSARAVVLRNGEVLITGGSMPCQNTSCSQPKPEIYRPSAVVMTTAHEYYNVFLLHYFITASAFERDLIERGGAGPGWIVTGETFGAWNVARDGSSEVCRFYGNPQPGPDGRRLGPNSHYYTIDPDECARLRADPRWSYEGVAFHAARSADGRCPSALQPLWRAFNNAPPGSDPNYRHSTDLALLDSMWVQGWSVERVAMCVP